MDNANQDREFQGVWIPKEIWLNEELTLQEKVLLVEIKSLDNEEGCYASNKHFEEFLGVGERRVQTIIQGLVKRRYLTSTFKYKEGTKEIEKRTLRIDKVKFFGIDGGGNIPNEVVNKTTPPSEQKCTTPNEQNCTRGGEEKCAVNNTIYKKKKKEKTEFDVLIEKYTANEKLRNTLYEFIKSRKAIKKPATTEALKRILKRLDGLAASDNDKLAILGESIMNGWAGVFPLKKEISKQNTSWEEGYF